MRLVTFEGGFGYLEGDAVVPMGRDLLSYLATGESSQGEPVPLASLQLRAPIPRPGKIIGVSTNYRDVLEYFGQPAPPEPILFAKWANSVIGPGDPILIPAATQEPDFEAELGVVIGRSVSDVGVPEALEYVAGYTCLNDVTAGDLIVHSKQLVPGKAIDTFLPMGPYLVTADEVGDPQDLAIQCWLNGELRQDSSTSLMVYGVAELVSFISRTIMLEPGDVIATGTPLGGAMGHLQDPPRFLCEGDEVTVKIERVGVLTNPVKARPRPIGKLHEDRRI
ncbi:MAG: fumarylacetoacetate hydrolase family protein [Chloroflexota bacterium]|nr:fumarylacetoacetate hydrolase family protein [Chloroflexota bacterium]